MDENLLMKSQEFVEQSTVPLMVVKYQKLDN